MVRTIKANYPGFDKSPENIDRLYKYLKEFPFETAKENVDAHILTEKFPPNIAEIRGRLGEQLDSKRSKEATAEHFANLDKWGSNNTPPPEGYWEAMRQKLRGEVDA
nr:replicative helicase loader/inhibitor [Paenibacillus monticola]